MPTIRFRQGIAVLTLVLSLAQASTLLADPATDTATRKAIQARYDVSDVALNKKDVTGALAIYTPDRAYVDKKARITALPAVKQQMTALVAAVTTLKANSRILTIKVKGADADVSVKEHVIITITDPKTKAVTLVVLDNVSTDVWTKTGATWLQKHSTLVSQSATQNGKAVAIP